MKIKRVSTSSARQSHSQRCILTMNLDLLRIMQTEICPGVPQPSRGPEIARNAVVLATILFPIVCLRITSRLVITHRLWWDDWFTLAGVLVMVPVIVFDIYGTIAGIIWTTSTNRLKLLLMALESIFGTFHLKKSRSCKWYGNEEARTEEEHFIDS